MHAYMYTNAHVQCHDARQHTLQHLYTNICIHDHVQVRRDLGHDDTNKSFKISQRILFTRQGISQQWDVRGKQNDDMVEVEDIMS